jgi:hypothetical protein
MGYLAAHTIEADVAEAANVTETVVPDRVLDGLSNPEQRQSYWPIFHFQSL